MALDEAGLKSIRDALLSYAGRTGCFDRSPLDTEPMGAPGAGMSFALTEGQIFTAPSGLASTSLTWQFLFEILAPAQEQTYTGALDLKLTAAAIAFLSQMASDIEMTGAGVAEGLVRRANVLVPVSQPGWKNIGGTQLRVRVVTVNIEINDAIDQEVA